jgi:TusA-related sulfurtransferase
MKPGAVLAIVLNEGEPLENVPRSIKELGHKVLSLNSIPDLPGSYRIRVLIR